MNLPLHTGLSLLVVLGALRAQDVDVRIQTIEELRRRVVDQDAQTFQSPGLRLHLLLSGKAVADVTHWGNLQIVKATDDQGTDLLATRDKDRYDPLARGMQLIDRDHMWFTSDDKPTDKLKLELVLGLSARAATRLSELDAKITLQQSKVETVRLDGAQKLAGKKLKVPAAKAAGADIQFVVLDKDSEEARFLITGEHGRIKAIRIVDGNGEDLSNGEGSMSSRNKKELSINLKSVPDAFAIEVEVVTDATEQVLPIKFSDVELP